MYKTQFALLSQATLRAAKANRSSLPVALVCFHCTQHNALWSETLISALHLPTLRAIQMCFINLAIFSSAIFRARHAKFYAPGTGLQASPVWVSTAFLLGPYDERTTQHLSNSKIHNFRHSQISTHRHKNSHINIYRGQGHT